MRTYSDRIMVERGETWTYDVLLQNRDGSPFIVSSQINNPHICTTVASSKYSQTGRYIANFWCPVKGNYKTFYSSQPVMLVSEDDDGTMPLPTGSQAVVADVARLKQAGKVTGYGDYAVYGWDQGGGVIEYRVYNDTTGAYEEEEYSFRYSVLFTSPITALWTEQSYVFTVKLLSGQLNPEYSDSNNGVRPLLNTETMTSLVQPMTLVVAASVDGSISGSGRQYNY